MQKLCNAHHHYDVDYNDDYHINNNRNNNRSDNDNEVDFNDQNNIDYQKKQHSYLKQ